MDSIEGTAMDEANPDDRAVSFRELRTVMHTIETNEKVHEQRRKIDRRDRLIGWILKVTVIAATAWLAIFQYHSENDLRQSLYETCLSGNASNRDTAAFYRQLAGLSRDPKSEFQILLHRQIERLEVSRDCAGKYLN